MAEPNLCNLTKTCQGIALMVYNHLFQILDIANTPDGAQQITPFTGFDLTAGDIAISLLDSVAHLGHREIAFGESSGVDQYLYLSFGTAVDRDLRHAWHRFHARRHMVPNEVLHGNHVQVARISR